LQAALAGPGAVHIVVEVPFPLEKFHMLYFQARGRIMRAERSRLYLQNVGPADVRRIAGEYWVASVRAWDGK
jgi:hypothetical protein